MKKLFQQFRFLWVGVVVCVLLSFYQAPAQTEQFSSTANLAQGRPVVIPSAPVITPSPGVQVSEGSIQLPPLPYAYEALEPTIDAATMRLHHDKHHKTYIDKLNQVMQKSPALQGKSVEALLQDLNSVPENSRAMVRNYGGGHLNHTMFWQIMGPEAGGQPTGALAEAINKEFGSFDTFKQQFNQAGGDRFGSGWVWLVQNPQGQLQITTTQNQDNPIMDGLYPILGNDVWEHAYYLKYQNRRAEYLTSWWTVVNWRAVERRYAQASSGKA
jgi:superoxide dismutase, Fe-Mn family